MKKLYKEVMRFAARLKHLHFSVIIIILALSFSFSTTTGLILAQSDQPDGPVYIVQRGDSLWDIAARFGVSVQDLETANGLSDPSQLAVGTRLIIPGLEGVRGQLITTSVSYGETLRSLSRRYQSPVKMLAKLNHVSSPTELYAGASLIIPVQNTSEPAARRATLRPGQSLLELAVIHYTSPWTFVISNTLTHTLDAIPGDVLQFPGDETEAGQVGEPDALPGFIHFVNLKPLPMVQGKTAIVQVSAEEGTSLSGSLAGRELHFFSQKRGEYVALQGIPAMAEPGLYPLTLEGKSPGGEPFSFAQSIYVKDGQYPFDPALTVNPETTDPAVTKPEDAEWNALASHFSPEKQWSGKFESPVLPPFSDCWPSLFGSRRSYNGSGYNYYHTGMDFCGGVGTEIHAPAAGTVVFAGLLTVRGNATMIDHGWGVYTGYMHQSKITVRPGEHVETGQVIGLVGGTGRVTGPHLHWELFAGQVQVDPFDWLQQAFP